MKVQLSPIIAGTMGWGAWGKQYDSNNMASFLHTCLDAGITSFDHADIYGDYTTEADFGAAYKQTGLLRAASQFITKCGIQHTKGRANTIKHYDYSNEYIVWSVENSLKNLQTDYIDVLLLHRPSPLLQISEVAEAITKLLQQGKILSFGVSNFTATQMALLQSVLTVSYNQIQFSLTHYNAMLDGTLDVMQLHNIIPMSWSPLGALFKEDTPQTLRIKPLLYSLAEKYRVTTDVILLAWVMQHPSAIIPVVGTTNIERIKNLPQVTSIKLLLTEWFALWEASMGNRVP